MATLKGIRPDVVPVGKPKFMISGRSGVGKTTFALQFPKPYFIDTEGGATRPQYREQLVAANAGYFGKDQGSQDFKMVIEEIKALATSAHEYKTLIIDSFSKLYNTAAADAEERVGNEFGRDKKEANRPTRQFMRWLDNIDMTVILICHHRQKWERRGKEVVDAGSTFDGYDKLEYDLDLWIEAEKLGDERTFVVRKSRVKTLVDGKEFPLDYKVFSDLYGREAIESQPKTVVMATEEDVKEFKDLLDVVKIPDETLAKWLSLAKVDEWSEMQQFQLHACTAQLKKLVAKATPATPVVETKQKAGVK